MSFGYCFRAVKVVLQVSQGITVNMDVFSEILDDVVKIEALF